MSKAQELINETTRYMQLAYNRGLMAPRPAHVHHSLYGHKDNEVSGKAANDIHQAIQLINDAANIFAHDHQRFQIGVRLKQIASELLNIYQTVG